MKGLVKLAPGPGNVSLVDLEEPHPGAGEVRIRVGAAALCGTDVLIHRGHRAVSSPVVLGHEFAGVVDEIGGEVGGLRLGDRVTSETDAFLCGSCRFCRSGDVQLCPRRRAIGQAVDGGFAELVVVPARGVHRLPAGVDVVAGALAEPLAVAVHAVVERAAVQPGERVLVVGPGTVGLLAAQVAMAMGGQVTIAGLGRHAERFRLAEGLGISSSIRLDDEAGVASLLDATRTEDGDGVDIAIECSGAVETLADCLRLVRKGGRVTLVGFYGGPAGIPAQQAVDGELSLIGSRGKRPSSFRRAVQLLGEGRVDTARLITHSFPLAAWEEALEIAAHPGTKVVFEATAG